MQKIMKAKFKGWCWHCQSKIKKGSKIEWDTETRKAKHVKCPKRGPMGGRGPEKGRVRFWSGK
jgi:hypothetical protein